MKYICSIFICCIIFFPCVASSLSCAPTEDRVFAKCEMGICSEFLYVREVSSFFQCSRRPVLENPPFWAKEVFELELDKSEYKTGSGVYELLIESSVWARAYVFSNAEEYRLYSEKARENNHQLGVLTRLSDQSMRELEVDWGAKAKREYKKMLFFKALDWASLAIAFLGLICSILWFNKWQETSVSVRWAFLAVLIQALIFLAAFATTSNWSMPLIALLGVFIPGVWLYQITSFVSSWRSRRRRA